MKAKAVKKFSASMGGRDIKCDAGDELEADKRTVSQLEAMGLVTTKAAKRGKAVEND